MAATQTSPKKPANREAEPVVASGPTRPVKLLVGFPGGATPAMAARTLAEPMSRAMGQPVIMENRPGASGNMAAGLSSRIRSETAIMAGIITMRDIKID